jgi:hypothetical protein
MPIENQVQYFVAIGSARDIQLERIASKGSKSREMIDFELQAILKNEILTKKIINDKKETIEQSFINDLRNYISEHIEAQKDVYPIMKKWLEEIKLEQSTQEPQEIAA